MWERLPAAMIVAGSHSPKELLRVAYLYRREHPLTLPSPPGVGERIKEKGPLSVDTISRRLIGANRKMQSTMAGFFKVYI
jgi:hypothetical protein